LCVTAPNERLVLPTGHIVLTGTEEQRNAPNAGKSDNGIDNSADQSVLSSTDPSDNVKLEQTDATPVQRADNGQGQRDSVHNHPAVPPSGRRSHLLFGGTADLFCVIHGDVQLPTVSLGFSLSRCMGFMFDFFFQDFIHFPTFMFQMKKERSRKNRLLFKCQACFCSSTVMATPSRSILPV